MREVELRIIELRAVAEANGLKIRFRNHRTNQGDFCIFIYDKSVRKSYIVGYDGEWDLDGTSPLSFETCLNSAHNWIKNRDRRFEQVNGKWIYKGK